MIVLIGPREQCPTCGDPLSIPHPDNEIVAAGGWCAPVSVLYDMPRLSRRCGACLASEAIGVPRELFRALDRGVPRGGITFGKVSA